VLEKEECENGHKSKRLKHVANSFLLPFPSLPLHSGRDAQQNEVLVKRYLREGDAYVHADVHGAATCIVRHKGRKAPAGPSSTGAAENSSGGGGKYAPISPIALHEAGCACVCRSAAWRAKMVTSAWWVHAAQVSKTAPTGEYLTTGSFMIRGKKHFLAPHALEMGLGVVFKVDEDSLARHAGERRERVEGEDGELMLGGEGEGGGPAGGEGEEERRRLQAQRHKRTKAALVQQPVEEEEEEVEAEEEEEEEEEEEDDEEGWAVAETPAAPEPQEAVVEDEGEVDEEAEEEDDEGNDNDEEEVGHRAAPASTSAASRADNEDGGKKGKDKDAGAGASGGGRLSAKERRLMKKGMALEEIRARERQAQEEQASSQQQQAKDDEVGDEKEGDEEDDEEEEGARRGLQKLGLKDGGRKEEEDGGNSKRGKKGKMKKMKKKYAEQDDEDRHLALQALGVVKPPAGKDKDKKGHKKGSSGGGPKVGKDGKDSKEAGAKLAEEMAQMDDAAWKEAWQGLPAWAQRMMEGWVEGKLLRFLQDLGAMELRALVALPSEAQQRAVLESFHTAVTAGAGGAAGRKVRNKSAVLGREIQKQVLASAAAPTAATSRGSTETAAAMEGGENGKPANGGDKAAFPISRRAAAKAEEEGMMALLQEEGVLGGAAGDDATQMEEEQRELRRLTGKPHPDDMLLFAVPVCAPYAALSPAYYKFRVKLTPGPQKKGKAAHQALEVFVRDREATPREVELLKAIPDNDLIASIMGDVKVSKPGIQATLLKAKKVKAKAAKTKSRGLRER